MDKVVLAVITDSPNPQEMEFRDDISVTSRRGIDIDLCMPTTSGAESFYRLDVRPYIGDIILFLQKKFKSDK